MSDEKPTQDSEDVKVTDRRKFDRSGRLRDDAPEDPAPAPRPSAAAGAQGAPESPPGDEAGAASGAPGPASGDGGTAGGRTAGVDFQSFVYFLYMTALHELGVPTEQGGAPRKPDLERARFFIEVLQMMKEKTAGNLETGETKMLDEVLANLQMQFVNVNRSAPSS